MNERHQALHSLLASLGHHSRFRIALRLLEGESSVGELALAIGLSQSCTTRHVQALERASVVRSRRDGKRVLVGLARSHADLAVLLDWIGPATAATAPRPNAVAGQGRRAAAPKPERPAVARVARGRADRAPVLRPVNPPSRPAEQEQPPAQASHSGKDADAVDVPDTPRRRLPEPIEDFLL